MGIPEAGTKIASAFPNTDLSREKENMAEGSPDRVVSLTFFYCGPERVKLRENEMSTFS